MSKKREMRKKRQKRVRRKIEGTPERPRLNVYRSLNHIYAQIIDDIKGETLVSASTLEDGIKEQVNSTGNKKAAQLVGEMIAQRAMDQGIDNVVFDRGGNLFHGRVQSLATGAREKGLKF